MDTRRHARYVVELQGGVGSVSALSFPACALERTRLKMRYKHIATVGSILIIIFVLLAALMYYFNQGKGAVACFASRKVWLIASVPGHPEKRNLAAFTRAHLQGVWMYSGENADGKRLASARPLPWRACT